MEKYLIIKEQTINKEDIEYYLKQNWEIIEIFDTTYRIGFYCKDLVTLFCNLELDLEFEWDNDFEYLGEYWENFEDWKENCKKILLEQKELTSINGYDYFIEESE